MRTHDSNDNPTPQAEKFDEMTGGYDDVDHARAAKRLNADLRAMDATPRGKHTPGPWHMAKKPYSRSKDCPSGWNVRADTAMPGDPPEHVVATAHGTDAYGFSAEANARLIASAPDLLEALQSLVNICTHPNATKAQMRQIANESRAAIARATMPHAPGFSVPLPPPGYVRIQLDADMFADVPENAQPKGDQ